jgi:hypothetical protein
MNFTAVRIATVMSCVLVSTVLTTQAIASQTDFGHLPLGFEKNQGQTAPNVQWLARTPESTLYLSGNDATVQLNHIDKVKRNGVEIPRARSASLRMSLVGAQPGRSSTGGDLQPGVVNYFIGNDRSHWQTDVPMYGQVRMDEVYPGVSLVYHGERGQLEYDFVVAPKADPKRIGLAFSGATPKIAANGDLLLPIPGDSTVRFDKPVVYQWENGTRIPVDSSYRLAGNGHVSFRLGRYDHRRELIIDPKLVFLGTLGAGVYPYATNLGQMTVDSTGAMYFIGTTNDPTYPITPGAYQKVCGPATGNNASNGGVYCGTYGATSAYVSKISADGTKLVYSTYLSGGGGYEQGTSIAVDSAGVAYLLGATASNDFPITSDAFQKLCQPGQNPGFTPTITPVSQCNNFGNGGGTEYTVNGPVFFFAKLSADGSSLLYASFLGGSSGATPVATALDSAGNWYLYGQTSVLDAANIYPTPGGSESVQFPGVSNSGYQSVSTATGYGSQTATNITYAAVLSKFSNDGHTLLYGTFLADETYGYNVFPQSLAVGANGIVFLGGITPAAHFPTTAGAVKAACTAVVTGASYSCTSEDAFVTAIDTTKSGQASLVYSTRLGGSAPTGYSPSSGSNIPNQQALGLAANAANDVYVTGVTYDQTFPVPSNGYQPTCNTFNSSNYLNCSTAFVIELNPTGTAILGGSFLSGPAAYYESSAGYKVVLDSSNKVYLYGTSQDGYNTFPLVNPVQGYSNNNEIYIATMSSDLTKLLFSTRIGNPSLAGGNAQPVNGLALDPSNNIYFAATTNDTSFAATPGTYTTAANSGVENHTFFGKISPVLLSDTTTLSVSPGNSVVAGTSVTLTATVAGGGSTAPTGSVTFLDGTTTLGTGSLGAGKASFTTTALSTATHSITASYGGDTNYEPSTSAAIGVTVTAPPPLPTVTISVAPSAITVGQSATVTWSSTNAMSCTASSAWSGAQATSGTLTVKPTAAGPLSYTLACTGAGGSVNGTAALTVKAAAPTVTISVSPTSITVGQSATVTWSSTNATSCTASSAWTGSQATSGTLTVTPTAAGSQSYALACTGAGGSANGSAALTVNAAATTTGTGTSHGGSGGGGAMSGWTLLALAALAWMRRRLAPSSSARMMRVS